MPARPVVHLGLAQAEGVYALAFGGDHWQFGIYGSLEDFVTVAIDILDAVQKQRVMDRERHEQRPP